MESSTAGEISWDTLARITKGSCAARWRRDIAGESKMPKKARGMGKRFVKGDPRAGRPKGRKNNKTLVLERVYQRCMARGFHPADFIIDCLQEKGLSVREKIDTAFRLNQFMEGVQPEAKPLTPATPADSVERAKETMQELEQLSQPLEPKPDGPPRA